jgi:uncharacterized protein YjbI with pentapeptide repeats
VLSNTKAECDELSGSRTHYSNFQGANMEGCVECPKGWD